MIHIITASYVIIDFLKLLVSDALYVIAGQELLHVYHQKTNNLFAVTCILKFNFYDECYDEVFLNNDKKIQCMNENLTFKEKEKKQVKNVKEAIAKELEKNKNK